MDRTLQQSETARKFTESFSNEVFVEKGKLAKAEFHHRVFSFPTKFININNRMKYFIVLQYKMRV